MAQPLTFTPIEEPSAPLTFTPIEEAPPAEVPRPPSRGAQLFEKFRAPATAAVGRVLENLVTPLVPLERMRQGESVRAAFGPESFTTQGAGGMAQQTREKSAAQIVPQTPLQAGILAGTLLAGPVGRALPLVGDLAAASPAITRIIGGTLGGAAGGYTEDPTLEGAVKGGAWGLGTTAVGEGIGKGAEWARRVSPGGQAAANEETSRRVADIARTVNPSAEDVISTAKSGLRPMHGPKTPAALQEAALGGGLHEAAQTRLQQQLADISARAGNPTFQGGVLEEIYKAMPPLQRASIGPVGPQGLTLQQAQLIRGWVGDAAFPASPIGQGVSDVAKQIQWWKPATQEITAKLGPLAPLWQKANQEYAGIALLQDALKRPNAFRGGANEIALNTPQLQQWLSLNRAPGRLRMGREPFEALAEAATGGGQLGTRDILAPGFGHSLDALRHIFRGEGGAPQLIAGPMRGLAPDIGSQWTGRGPLQLPTALKLLIDSVIQRHAPSVAP